MRDSRRCEHLDALASACRCAPVLDTLVGVLLDLPVETARARMGALLNAVAASTFVSAHVDSYCVHAFFTVRSCLVCFAASLCARS